MDPITLGQLLQQMGPGAIGGMPQMAPPPGIPWEQAPQAAPTPPPVMRNPNPALSTTQNTMKRTPAAPGGYSTPQVGQDIMSAFAEFLASNRSRWAEEDRNTYEDERGAENAPAAPKYGSAAPESDFNPESFVDASGPSPSAQPSPIQPEMPAMMPDPMAMFSTYGAPMPTKRPLDLGSMLYGNDVPLPEPGAREGQVPVPEKKPGQAAPPPAKPASSKASNGGSQAPVATSAGQRALGVPPFQNAPYGESYDPYSRSAPPFDNNVGRFLLQAGLSLMVPKWGGPLANIGSAVGEGAEAVGRSKETDQKTKMDNARLDVERAKVAKIGLGRKGAKESSGSKRLKEKTPAQQFAAGLSPEASLYFTQRVKDLNKLGEDDTETPESKYEKILGETQKIDRRARANRGMAKSEEIPDAILQTVAGTPQEATALAAVAADPVQSNLLTQRLNAIKAVKANASGQPK